MSYYEDEVPVDLETGEVYTSRAIQIFLQEKRNIIVLADHDHLPNSDEVKYVVKNKISKYLHRNENRTYMIPSTESVIYEIQRV
ncbi:hypothetical protein [Peribacillus sp. TH24]|uniref:hypothetical protein n=1 Tax=Peribacillus sp. TH24 TaxID=2798483 RepID=UPI001911D8D9|nr:hypothetical protein [Peribacillus sp. TH24]MBK5446051.1 hypothetical protein [Peribacillus sp. TH24]